MSTTVNAFKAYLSQSLESAGSETTIYLDRITTLNGETIQTSDFSTFGRGTVTLDPLSPDYIEFASFTGVDGTNIALTGVTRGLSAKSNTSSTGRMSYHGVGTVVIISFGVHNLEDLKTYIDNLVAGTIGNASDTTAGTTRITEDLGTRPRAMSALVSQQSVPNMTLKINPFAFATLDSNISYTGGNTSSFSAPVSNPRIDLIVYSTTGSAIAIRQGSESASPSEPTPTTGDIVLCSVYLRVGTTALYERDDSVSTHGYIKRWYQIGRYGQIISSSSGSGDAGKIVKTNSSGQIDRTFINASFGGTGADGALSISSGTTTIDLNGARFVIKNYTSISITGTGQLAFSNPHTNGTIIVLKSQGGVTITSSTTPAINAASLGAAGGASVSGSATSSGDGLNGNAGYSDITINDYGDKSTTGAAGVGGAAPAFDMSNLSSTIYIKYKAIFVASGGGSGMYNNGGGSTVTTGSGGRGGGTLIIECGGALNFTGTISVAGGNGGDASGTGAAARGGGGGGGGGGYFLCLYNTLTANSGTITKTGGTGGSGITVGGTTIYGGGGGSGQTAGSGGASVTVNGKTGGDGGTGYSLIAANTELV